MLACAAKTAWLRPGCGFWSVPLAWLPCTYALRSTWAFLCRGVPLQSHDLETQAIHMVGLQGALCHHSLYCALVPSRHSKAIALSVCQCPVQAVTFNKEEQANGHAYNNTLLGSDRIVMQCCAHLATSVCKPWMSCSCSACLACKSCMAASCCANLCQGAASSTAAGDLGWVEEGVGGVFQLAGISDG